MRHRGLLRAGRPAARGHTDGQRPLLAGRSRPTHLRLPVGAHPDGRSQADHRRAARPRRGAAGDVRGAVHLRCVRLGRGPARGGRAGRARGAHLRGVAADRARRPARRPRRPAASLTRPGRSALPPWRRRAYGDPASDLAPTEGVRMSEATRPTGEPVLVWLERRTSSARSREAEFHDARLEYRRLFSELWGTFLLVLVAAGGGVVGASAFGGDLTLATKALAPGMMVMGIILFMGTISGAHLNPAVTLAFAVRGNFPWRRVPGYIV